MVEDIAAVRELIEVHLRLRGYDVIVARDGQEALAMVHMAHPSVIITDILMPRLDGFALAHQLRADPHTSPIPIIFLSATYVSAEDERFALHLGAMRFLPKPVDSDELFIAVADALTGQARSITTISERDFYSGYRQRLEAKLRQKSAQISRNQQQFDAAPPDQRETYRRLLAEAQEQFDEIQRELGVLVTVMQGLG